MYQNHIVKPLNSPSTVVSGTTLPPLGVGLLGLGTVGGGTYRVLRRNAQLIADRAGRHIKNGMVAVRDIRRAAALVDDDVILTSDPLQLVQNPNLDVIVDSIGGTWHTLNGSTTDLTERKRKLE